MALQIFISYKSEYRDFAQKVRNEVRSWGHSTWFDMDDIPKGAYFRDAIEEGLDRSDVMLTILTEEAQRSREVMAEVDYFLSQNKPLVPLKRGEFKLRYIFITIQWIDFTKDESNAFTDLQKRLTQLADSHAAPSAEPPPAEVTRDGTVVPGSAVIGGLVEDVIPKPNASTPVPQPSSSPILPPMQAAPIHRDGGILGTLAGILMLPFAGIAALVGWLRSSGGDEAELARTNRAAMLAKVREFWVVGVLENALKESGAFDLGLSAAPGAVLKHIDYGDYALPTSANIGDVFNDLNRELLILGAPGAGKTIMLLQLAKALIEKEKNEPPSRQESREEPIPVVFNLSSWAAERKPLEAWLVDELRLKYQVPKKVAQTWVETEQLTLLLDGLDEVAENYRNDCVDAINAYRQKYAKTDLVVCSRIKDYEVLTSKLDLRGAITLQPLSTEQVNHYIDRPELSALRDLLKTDVTLQEMAGTPFLLNTMAYAYQGMSELSLRIPNSTDSAKTRRNHLFDVYVEKRLTSSISQYAPAQTRHYLAWLAQKMSEFKQSVFFIEGLKPKWLGTKQKERHYKLIVSLVIALMFGLMFGLPIVLVFGLMFGWANGMVIGLSFTLVLVFTSVLSIRQDDKTSLGSFLEHYNKVSFIDLAGMFVWGAIVLVEVLVEGLAGESMLKIVPVIILFIVIIIMIIFGRIFGFAGGLAIGLMFGFAGGQGIGIAKWLRDNLQKVGEVATRHALLRFFLNSSGDISFSYTRFLDYCASIQILRKVGGGYIFVHRYLLEYFAELEA